jgi:hypothetical protein
MPVGGGGGGHERTGEQSLAPKYFIVSRYETIFGIMELRDSSDLKKHRKSMLSAWLKYFEKSSES